MRPLGRVSGILAATALLYTGVAPASAQVYEPPQYPQYMQYPDGAPPVTPGVPADQAALAPEQLDQLLAPIALYPDPLLSLIFPAATYPQDVIAAEQWLESTPQPTEEAIAAQPWDDSIKGLVHYPTVLKMMADQPDWTAALGAAFLNQQQDVMDSVQRLRAAAQAAQNLQTNQQEQVLADNGAIRIEPVDPNVLYVPQYDPNLVYENQCPVVFGAGLPIGLWCADDFDWGGRRILVGGGWFNGWHHPAEWDRHPPGWFHQGWHEQPRIWQRSERRAPPPRITPNIIAHAGLQHPRVPVRVVPGHEIRPAAPRVSVGRGPVVAPSRNIFSPPASAQEIQRDRARIQPAPRAPVRVEPRVVAPPPRAVAPAPRIVAPAPRVVAPAPRIVAPAPRVVAPAPRIVAPAPRAVTPPNVFGGGAGGAAARAQADRGRASRGR